MPPTEPPPVLDATVETAWLVALTVPIAVATVMTASFWPLTLGAVLIGIAGLRRRLPALILVAAVLGLGALPVWIGMNLD